LKEEVYFITKKKYGGAQRKLAWFKKHLNGIVFDVFGFFLGSHWTYHQDGTTWRTSPASNYKAEKVGKYLPLDGFEGLHQMGTSMIFKSELLKSPILKKRDRKKALTLQEVDLEVYPSEVINIVVEFLEPSKRELIASKDVAPPPDATMFVIESIQPWIVLTILGHKHNLLIEPQEDGFIVHHHNTRYSTNLPRTQYRYEAYEGL